MSVVAMIAAGVLVMLLTVTLPPLWRWGAVAALVAAGVAAAAVLRVLRGTWDDSRGARPRWREKLYGIRVAALEFTAGHPGRLWRVLALHLAFHALAVLEIFITLRWMLGDTSPTLAQAMVFEALNRVVTVGFKFVPFRIGVDEAASGWLAPVLALDPAIGVTQAVIRKVRNLAWSGVGLAIVAAHPSRAGSPSIQES